MAEKLHEQSFGWHADLPDVPGKSAAEMKAFFDAPHHLFLERINELIDEIEKIGQQTTDLEERAEQFENVKRRVSDIEEALPGEPIREMYPTVHAVVKFVDKVNKILRGLINGNKALADEEFEAVRNEIENRIAELRGLVEEMGTVAQQALEAAEGNTAALDSLRSDAANAVRGVATGSVLSINDISPFAHPMKLQLVTKNKLPYPFTETTKTINGITFTDNGDGTITVSGTATTDANFILNDNTNPIKVAGETVTVSGCPAGGSQSTFFILVYDTVNGRPETGYTLSFVPDGNITVSIRIKAGTTVENLVFKPQIERGDTATEFTKGVTDFSEHSLKVATDTEEKEYAANADGSVDGVQGKGTPMTLSTDASGVLIECEYNRDLNKTVRQIEEDLSKVVPRTWTDVQNIVRAGKAKNVFHVGDQFVCNHEKYGELIWDIIGIDHDTPIDNTKKHSLTIQLHHCFKQMEFDTKDALYYAENGLTPGTYNFYIKRQPWYSEDADTTFQFTLTKEVPKGGQIVLDAIHNQTLVGKNVKTYQSNTSSEVIESAGITKGSRGINLGTADGSVVNLNHIYRALRGSSNWEQSDIRQFLNSSNEAGNVWTPQTNFDRPPWWAEYTEGFLKSIDEDFLSVLGEVKKETVLNPITDGGGLQTVAEKIFLLSTTEAFCGKTEGVSEGKAYPYYSDNSVLSVAETSADAVRIKYTNDGFSKAWWLRTPNILSTSVIRVISVDGRMAQDNANKNYGIAPACCIV